MRPITALRSHGMPIGELSGLTGVNVETIRYYEKIKMHPPRYALRGVIGSTGQKRRAYSYSYAVDGSSGSLSIKSARCLISAAQGRRHAPRSGRSLSITSKTSTLRSMTL